MEIFGPIGMEGWSQSGDQICQFLRQSFGIFNKKRAEKILILRRIVDISSLRVLLRTQDTTLDSIIVGVPCACIAAESIETVNIEVEKGLDDYLGVE